MKVAHKLGRWEKKWGWIGFSAQEITKLPKKMKEERFTLFVKNEKLTNRRLDRWGRIWVNVKPLQQFKVGDVLLVSSESMGTYRIKKQQ